MILYAKEYCYYFTMSVNEVTEWHPTPPLVLRMYTEKIVQ